MTTSSGDWKGEGDEVGGTSYLTVLRSGVMSIMSAAGSGDDERGKGSVVT